MATPTDEPMVTSDAVSDVPTMEASVDISDARMVTSGGVSDSFKVTRGFGGVVENAKVNVKLYLHQITGTNQSIVIGTTGVSNWEIYNDRRGSRENLVASGQGMFTYAGMPTQSGSWNQWFTIVFNSNVQRFKGSSLQVMGANDIDEEEENEWAIVGGTGEFALARGTIKRKQIFSSNPSIIKQELTIEFFCRMKVVPAPKMMGPWGHNVGALREMEGKSQRLESVSITYLGTVQMIEFSYIDEEGQIRTAGPWGRKYESPDTKTKIIKFGPSELVKKISGAVVNRSPRALGKFEIVTNHNNRYGPFGNLDSSDSFSHTVPEDETVVGFFALTESDITMIGLYTI